MAIIKRKKKIRVLLADDHPVVRKGIRSWLTGAENLEVVDEAVNGLEAIFQPRPSGKRLRAGPRGSNTLGATSGTPVSFTGTSTEPRGWILTRRA